MLIRSIQLNQLTLQSFLSDSIRKIVYALAPIEGIRFGGSMSLLHSGLISRPIHDLDIIVQANDYDNVVDRVREVLKEAGYNVSATQFEPESLEACVDADVEEMAKRLSSNHKEIKHAIERDIPTDSCKIEVSEPLYKNDFANIGKNDFYFITNIDIFALDRNESFSYYNFSDGPTIAVADPASAIRAKIRYSLTGVIPDSLAKHLKDLDDIDNTLEEFFS